MSQPESFALKGLRNKCYRTVFVLTNIRAHKGNPNVVSSKDRCLWRMFAEIIKEPKLPKPGNKRDAIYIYIYISKYIMIA